MKLILVDICGNCPCYEDGRCKLTQEIVNPTDVGGDFCPLGNYIPAYAITVYTIIIIFFMSAIMTYILR
jgi:hypothetical protein